MSNQNDQCANSVHKNLSTRVSYSINNYQPVISTIIGSDPLFYMDCTEDELFEEDEAYMDFDIDFDSLEEDLSALNKEVTTLDQLSSSFIYTAEEKLKLFQQTKAGICGTQKAAPCIEDLTSFISQSRMAQTYLEFAAKHNVEIMYCAQTEGAFYDRIAGKITLNPSLAIEMQTLLLAQELRRHWQHRNGVLLNPLNFHPDSAILMNRSLSTDIISAAIRVAWELQLSGQKQVWQYIENSSFNDLARAFTREAYLDFRSINNGMAATSVFEAWFLSDRCRMLDRQLIRTMLADVQGFVFDTENVQHGITASFIAGLGEMPYGKNYLSKHVETILNDQIFTEVRDRSNANFLWFIKFERTFRETEQELQTKEAHPAEHSPSHASTLFNADTQNDQNIIKLNFDQQRFDAIKATGTAGHGSTHNADTTNVIFMRAEPTETL